MVECIYSTEVLLNSPKEKTLAIVLYGTITINDEVVCKMPLEVDVFMDEAYYITMEYEVFVRNWEQQRMEFSKLYVNQMVRFYQNVEDFKSKLKQIS
jgi:hypothetical protein